MSAHAARFNGDDPLYAPCVETAAKAFRINPLLIKVLLDVEGGKPGTASVNTNASVDLGPMQVNDRVWLPHVERLGITRQQLQHDACINIYVGTWIYMQEFARVQNVGLALAHYHSKTARHQSRYLGLIERAIVRRQAAAPPPEPSRAAPMELAGQ